MIPKFAACFVALLLFSISFKMAYAQDRNALSTMPSTEVVLKKVTGKTDADSYARQAAAFFLLQDLTRMLAGNKKAHADPQEADKLVSSYSSEILALQDKYEQLNKKKARNWNTMVARYRKDGAFNREVKSLIPASSMLLINETEENLVGGFISKPSNKINWGYKIMGVLILIGSFLCYREARAIGKELHRRAFERTNEHGVQVFANAEESYRITRLEERMRQKGGWLVVLGFILFFLGCGVLFMP
jgi:hypothetical protein